MIWKGKSNENFLIFHNFRYKINDLKSLITNIRLETVPNTASLSSWKHSLVNMRECPKRITATR